VEWNKIDELKEVFWGDGGLGSSWEVGEKAGKLEGSFEAFRKL
jgi:hypothetical protein